MNGKVANSEALGFGVLAIALWMFSVANAGIGGTLGIAGAGPLGFGSVMHGVATLAMLALLIAGIASFLRHEAWLGFFFLLWSGLFWGGGFGTGMESVGRFDGWFMMTLTLVNFYMWLAAWKSGRLGGAVSFMVLLLWISLLCYGLRGFFGFWVLDRVGGAFGLASALVAFYVSAATLAVTHLPDRRYPGILVVEQYPPRDPPVEPRI